MELDPLRAPPAHSKVSALRSWKTIGLVHWSEAFAGGHRQRRDVVPDSAFPRDVLLDPPTDLGRGGAADAHRLAETHSKGGGLHTKALETQGNGAV